MTGIESARAKFGAGQRAWLRLDLMATLRQHECAYDLSPGHSMTSTHDQHGKSRRVGLLVLAALSDDPRVRRQGDALAAAGYDVIGFGLAGGQSAVPTWPLNTIKTRTTGQPVSWARARRRVQWFGAAALSRVHPASAGQAYFGLDGRLGPLLQAARAHRCDLWIANDWNTLPVALRLADEQGARVLYDTHELATEEYAERLRWRLLNRPFRRALEGHALQSVEAVTAVSDGIADRLQRLYHLPQRPVVVRNMPRYQPMPFRATGAIVRVLYHGVIAPGRGLEATTASLARWRQEFTLSIRGPGDPAYIASLASAAAAAGQSHRVTFLDPVPMVDLVTAAAAFDIGLLALPAHSAQNAYALPNKVFEYTMAGLALCVSDLPEMARLVTRYDLGHTIKGADPEAIALAINAFDRPAIDAAKTRALKAARELSWDAEQNVFLACVEAALDRS